MDLFATAQKLGSPLKAEQEAALAALVDAREAAIPALVQVLQAPRSPDASPVAKASLLLGALRARDALPVFFALVDGGALSADERAFVARALAEILDGRDAFDDRAWAALEKLAADADRYVRAFAAQSFAALGDPRAKARIQALAQDRDPWVREKATPILRRMLAQEAAARADVAAPTLGDFAQLVADAQASGGPLAPALADLGDVRRAVRDAAIAELVRAGKAAVPHLLEKLNQPAARARIGAATALGRLQATEATGPLLIAATTPASTPEEHELRAVALRALTACLTGLEEGLGPSLLPLARDADRFVRAAALVALGRLADREGMKLVVAALLEDDAFVVESAAVALSEGVREDDDALAPQLLDALDRSKKPAVREAILLALSRIQLEGERHAAVRVHIRHRVRKDVALGATSSARKAAIVLLERLFEDNDPPPLSLVDDVLDRLADDNPDVRLVAASFCARHVPAGMTGVVERLDGALRRKEVPIGLLCLEALVRHDTQQARIHLQTVAQREPLLAARATELLAAFTPRTEPWTFVAPSAPPSAPPRGESQRPSIPPAAGEPPRKSRVRPAGESGAVVEARFDEDAT